MALMMVNVNDNYGARISSVPRTGARTDTSLASRSFSHGGIVQCGLSGRGCCQSGPGLYPARRLGRRVILLARPRHLVRLRLLMGPSCPFCSEINFATSSKMRRMFNI